MTSTRPRSKKRMEEIVEKYGETLQNNRRHLLREYRLVHAAVKVVGVGSVGTRHGSALLVGINNDDPLFIQFKEAKRFGARALRRRPRNTSMRRARRPRPAADAGTSDILLGWTEVAFGGRRGVATEAGSCTSASSGTGRFPATTRTTWSASCAVRAGLRLDARPRACAFRRPGRDRDVRRREAGARQALMEFASATRTRTSATTRRSSTR